MLNRGKKDNNDGKCEMVTVEENEGLTLSCRIHGELGHYAYSNYKDSRAFSAAVKSAFNFHEKANR